jgi:hypothetical protein
MQNSLAANTTIELYSHGLPRRTDTRFINPLLSVEAVDLLQEHFNLRLPSLRKITVNIDLCAEDSSNELMVSNELIGRMRGYGWIVTVTVPKAVEFASLRSAREFGYVGLERENEGEESIMDWYPKYNVVDCQSEYGRKFFPKSSPWSFSDPYYHTRPSTPRHREFVSSWHPR